MEHKSKLDGNPLAPGDSGRFSPDEPSIPERETKMMDLISSIKAIEEYLIDHDTLKPIQDDWPFVAGRSSFYLWLKETYRRRSLRSRYFNAEYFSGEAAWNILLDLAAAQIEGKRIAVTSACIASGVPPTTALRWIAVLEGDGMILKENDFSDKRRTFLRISEYAMKLVNSYYNDLHSHPRIPRRRFEKS